jgi:hypothetical protein
MGLYGGYGVTVNTGACGALNSGSIPDSHPRFYIYPVIGYNLAMQYRKTVRLVCALYIVVTILFLVFSFVYTWDNSGRSSNYLVMSVLPLIIGIVAIIFSAPDLLKKPVSYLSWFTFVMALVFSIYNAYVIILLA